MSGTKQSSDFPETEHCSAFNQCIHGSATDKKREREEVRKEEMKKEGEEEGIKYSATLIIQD